MQTRITSEMIALENFVREQIVQSVRPEMVRELDPCLQDMKVFMEAKLETSMRAIIAREEESASVRRLMETEMGALREENRGLRETLRRREIAVDNALCYCVRENQKIWHVISNKNGQVDVQKLREQINKLEKDLGLGGVEQVPCTDTKIPQPEVLSVPSSDVNTIEPHGNSKSISTSVSSLGKGGGQTFGGTDGRVEKNQGESGNHQTRPIFANFPSAVSSLEGKQLGMDGYRWCLDVGTCVWFWGNPGRYLGIS